MRAAPVVLAVVAAAALVGAYVALGGRSYEPSPVANPCAPRPAPAARGTGEKVELVLLAAADRTACRLGVSREELVLALRSVDDLDALARKEEETREELEEALRAGLVGAVEEGRRQGLIGDRTARGLLLAADHFPLGILLSLLRGASSLVG